MIFETSELVNIIFDMFSQGCAQDFLSAGYTDRCPGEGFKGDF